MATERRAFDMRAYPVSDLDITAIYAPVKTPVTIVPTSIHPIGQQNNPIADVYSGSDIRGHRSIVKHIGAYEQPAAKGASVTPRRRAIMADYASATILYTVI